MASLRSRLHPGLLVLALAIAFLLWTVAHGTSPIEVVFDVPIELHGLDEELVVVGQSVDAVNLRVQGSRAALRNVGPGRLTYRVDLVGSHPGRAIHEVLVSKLALPSGARPVSHSPTRLWVELEERGRKSVRVRAEAVGEPKEGYRVARIEVIPKRVWLTGARSQVLSLEEVVAEPADVTGLDADAEIEVPLLLGAGNVWLEEAAPVKIAVVIEPIPAPLPEEGEELVAPTAQEVSS